MPVIDLGRVVGEDAFDALETSATFEYDGAGKIISAHEAMPGGDTRDTVFNYDANSNLTGAVQTHDGTTRTHTYTYDADGNLTAVEIVES
jgi:YD repeat-containing protein